MDDEWWMIEVERPWVGMTSEGLTEVEQARAELVKTLGGIRKELSAHRTAERARRAMNDTMRSSAGRRVFVIALACCAGGATAPVLLAARSRRRGRPDGPARARRAR
jgi:hypothetical protein